MKVTFLKLVHSKEKDAKVNSNLYMISDDASYINSFRFFHAKLLLVLDSFVSS